MRDFPLAVRGLPRVSVMDAHKLEYGRVMGMGGLATWMQMGRHGLMMDVCGREMWWRVD